MSVDLLATTLDRALAEYYRGSLERALAELDAAEEIARELGRGVPFILIQRVSWLRELGDVPQAEEAMRAVEAELRRAPGSFEPDALAHVRTEQGIVAMRRGAAEAAETSFVAARAMLHDAGRVSSVFADASINLAALYYTKGRFDEARTLAAEAEAIDRAADNAPALSNDLNLLGVLSTERGDHQTALHFLGEAFEIARANGLGQQAAEALANIGIALTRAGDDERAEAAFSAAEAFFAESGRRHERAGMTVNRAIAASRRGDDELARSLLQQASGEFHELGDELSGVTVLLNLVPVELRLDEVEWALAHAREAVELAETAGAAGDLWAVHLAEAKARVAHAVQAEDGPKLQDELMSALDSYGAAADAVELLRLGIGRPEERERLLWDKEMIYEDAAALCVSLGLGERALVFSERARARAFLDIMGTERIARLSEAHETMARRLDLTRQLRSAVGRDARQLLAELSRLRVRAAADAPMIAAITDVDLPDLPAIVAALPEQAALIEFFLLADARLLAFALTRDGLVAAHAVDLAELDLTAEVARFRAEIKEQRDEEATARRLWATLFDPIFAAIDDSRRLLIVPYGPLHQLPFAALRCPSTDVGSSYLFQRFSHAVLPSASLLPRVRDLPRTSLKSGRALVLGDPTGDLRGAAAEARAVAARFSTQPLLGAQATRHAVLGAGDGLGLLHIASHGSFIEQDPLLSGLELADGRLTAEDLIDGGPAADLFTLSACVTGLSERRPGDELVGLTRAAAVTGTPSVVTTLWPISDESSVTFFEAFYEALFSGAGKDEALDRARLTLLSSSRFRTPLHWAPFVLFGDVD